MPAGDRNGEQWKSHDAERFLACAFLLPVVLFYTMNPPSRIPSPVAEMSRRHFLGGIIAAGVAPMILPARIFGASAPGNILRIGCIGSGRMGFIDMRAAIGQGIGCGSRIVAVCDVDRPRMDILKREGERLSRELHGDEASEISMHEDFRELLARKDIDGVIIATPDYAHAFIAIEAARAGKGVYLEKPLTYAIPEGQALVKAVRDHGIVLQTGSQQRSSIHFHRVCWLVRNGRIGTIKEIEVTNPLDSGVGNPAPMPVPEGLNYVAWMGPTTDEPYTEDRVHTQNDPNLSTRPGWLQIEKYCRGMVTGWGAHMYDIAQWGLGTDFNSGPVEITAQGEFPDRWLFNVHTSYSGTARYGNGVVMKSQNGTAGTIKFIGTDGWLCVKRGKFDASDPNILRESTEGGIQLVTSSNHMGNFLQCLRSRQEPVAPVEVGHRSNTVCLLHHISMKTGRTIHWDPSAEKIIGDPGADKLVECNYRPGFSLGS